MLGIFIVVLVGALGAIFVLGLPLPLLGDSGDDCRGACGPKTRCEQGVCVPVPAVDRSKHKRRRKKPARKTSKPARRAGKALPWAKDGHVPRFRPNAVQKIDAQDGSGRLDEFEIDKVLATLEPAWMRCIERADARAAGALEQGRVKIAFGVNGQGKVTGVNATAPAALKKFGILPCVRVAAYKARFPAYDGPVTRVTTHFDVAF